MKHEQLGPILVVPKKQDHMDIINCKVITMANSICGSALTTGNLTVIYKQHARLKPMAV